MCCREKPCPAAAEKRKVVVMFDWFRRAKKTPPSFSAESTRTKAMPTKQIPARTDWRNSLAHLELLTRFLNGCAVSQYDQADYLTGVLKEPPAAAIKRFLQDGMLTPASPSVALCSLLQAKELKALLKQRGIKVSGTKPELAARLAEIDIAGTLEVIGGRIVYQCTETATVLAHDYIREQAKKRNAAHQEIVAALQKRDFEKAARIEDLFAASQPFAGGLSDCDANISYELPCDIATTVRKLNTMFSETPGILRNVEPARLEVLRMVAAETLLWNDRDILTLPDDFETGIHLDPLSAVRMFHFFCIYKENLRSYADAGIEAVVWMASGPCPACQKLDGRIFRITKVPEVPCPSCINPSGCTCCIGAHIPEG